MVTLSNTPEGCARQAKNAEARGRADIARAARRRRVTLLAEGYSESLSVAERDAIEVTLAYEEVLASIHGKATKATRTWQMIRDHGILPAVARIVTRREQTKGYERLVEMGMEDMTFEQVVLRHPESFDSEVVAAARSRLDALSAES